MVEIKIESNVPIPEAKYKWPFSKLDVGQSFIAGDFSGELQRNMTSIAAYYTKKYGYKYKTRQVGKKLRVWRVL